MRAAVLIRDKGVCAKCGLDTEALRGQLERLKSIDEKAWKLKCEELKIPKHRLRGSLFDVDHILEVCEGGGETGLSNAQSLCLSCHSAKTVALNKRRVRIRPK
jgi:5-methylcytosine-specific restriction endonuclease McrA